MNGHEKIFVNRKSQLEVQNLYTPLHSQEGQIGVFNGPILAPSPYAWHPCFQLKVREDDYIKEALINSFNTCLCPH